VDFGLFYYCQGRGVPHDQAYAEMLDQIALAETLGFGECWFAEHHFTDYSLLPSPNLMIRRGPAAHDAHALGQLRQRAAPTSPTRGRPRGVVG
jgi:alkanesulfonate monooxygenase SsuD/methylene tetrahydromethanopterin reductase-like flavin-dependent oxidoreductase (luciferase family)